MTNPDSTTETLSYDDNGQLVKSEKSTAGGGGVPVEVTGYVWNDQGMLVKVILPGGEPVEYEYDGNQRLISRKSSDGVDNFVQSGWDIVTKMDDVGKRTYYTGSSAVESEDSVKYFHYNHRGDTVLVTDANGEILHNLNYEAYGKPTNNEGIPINNLSLANSTSPTGSASGNFGRSSNYSASGNNLPNLFVGASGIRYDTKTNLHYMRFRWFSPSQMRFISPDLLMDLNRYAYVSGNPVNRIDPSGQFETDIFIPSVYKAITGKAIPKPPSGNNISEYASSPIHYAGFGAKGTAWDNQFDVGFEMIIFWDLLGKFKNPIRVYPHTHPLNELQVSKESYNKGFNFEISALYLGGGASKHYIAPEKQPCSYIGPVRAVSGNYGYKGFTYAYSKDWDLFTLAPIGWGYGGEDRTIVYHPPLNLIEDFQYTFNLRSIALTCDEIRNRYFNYTNPQ